MDVYNIESRTKSIANFDKHQREIKSIVTSRCNQNKICAVRL